MASSARSYQPPAPPGLVRENNVSEAPLLSGRRSINLYRSAARRTCGSDAAYSVGADDILCKDPSQCPYDPEARPHAVFRHDHPHGKKKPKCADKTVELLRAMERSSGEREGEVADETRSSSTSKRREPVVVWIDGDTGMKMEPPKEGVRVRESYCRTKVEDGEAGPTLTFGPYHRPLLETMSQDIPIAPGPAQRTPPGTRAHHGPPPPPAHQEKPIPSPFLAAGGRTLPHNPVTEQTNAEGRMNEAIIHMTNYYRQEQSDPKQPVVDMQREGVAFALKSQERFREATEIARQRLEEQKLLAKKAQEEEVLKKEALRRKELQRQEFEQQQQQQQREYQLKLEQDEVRARKRNRMEERITRQLQMKLQQEYELEQKQRQEELQRQEGFAKQRQLEKHQLEMKQRQEFQVKQKQQQQEQQEHELKLKQKQEYVALMLKKQQERRLELKKLQEEQAKQRQREEYQLQTKQREEYQLQQKQQQQQQELERRKKESQELRLKQQQRHEALLKSKQELEALQSGVRQREAELMQKQRQEYEFKERQKREEQQRVQLKRQAEYEAQKQQIEASDVSSKPVYNPEQGYADMIDMIKNWQLSATKGIHSISEELGRISATAAKAEEQIERDAVAAGVTSEPESVAKAAEASKAEVEADREIPPFSLGSPLSPVIDPVSTPCIGSPSGYSPANTRYSQRNWSNPGANSSQGMVHRLAKKEDDVQNFDFVSHEDAQDPAEEFIITEPINCCENGKNCKYCKCQEPPQAGIARALPLEFFDEDFLLI